MHWLAPATAEKIGIGSVAGVRPATSVAAIIVLIFTPVLLDPVSKEPSLNQLNRFWRDACHTENNSRRIYTIIVNSGNLLLTLQVGDSKSGLPTVRINRTKQGVASLAQRLRGGAL
jgi:hypothetical protein